MAEGYEYVVGNLFASFRAMPTPATGTNANDIKKPGVYEISYTPSYVNFPSGDNGYLIVIRRYISATNMQVIQFWIGTYSGNLQYRRFRNDSDWTSWYTIQKS